MCAVDDGWLNARECGASGSEFEAAGAIRAGSNRITVKDVGDFAAGQWVTVSRCHVEHYGTVYNQAEPYYARNQSPLRDEVELRGLNPDRSWEVFFIHFEKTSPVTFSWVAVDPECQPDYWRWTWQGKNLPLTGDWLPLRHGVEMRLQKQDWVPGQAVSFHARNRLTAQIQAVEGHTLILSQPATRDAADAVVRHLDQFALQAAVDRAVAEKRSLFIPSGRYRLTDGLTIKSASLRIEGQHRDQTILDISEANTSVFWIAGGRDVAIRNLAMVGHTGYEELPSDPFVTASGFAFWPLANQQMEIKGCAAANIVGTEHLLFEDLKVTRMVSEAFYLHGSDRFGYPPYVQAPHEGMPELAKQHTKSCIYHRCTVSDCNMNAFNNNDFAENTSILHCHVDRVGNFCEQASRFTRVIGNYVHCHYYGSVHCGVKRRSNYGQVGSGQAMISDNVFEGGLGRGLVVANAATQVVIANNIFVNHSTDAAISIIDATPANGFPTRSVIVKGNVIDLTCVEGQVENDRVGVAVGASNVIVADNQIYARGAASGRTTGISIADHAVGVHVHDNLIESCGHGIRTGARTYLWNPQTKGFAFEFRHTESEVVEVTGPCTFRDQALPSAWDWQDAYRGWSLRWLTGANAGKTSIIERFEAGKRAIALKDGLPMSPGDRFAVHPRQANWQVHHNTIQNCTHPLVVDLLGGENVVLKDNLISPTPIAER